MNMRCVSGRRQHVSETMCRVLGPKANARTTWSTLNVIKTNDAVVAILFLQLCVVAIVGFILYCVTYHPDERSTVQFIVKVGLLCAWINDDAFMLTVNEAL